MPETSVLPKKFSDGPHGLGTQFYSGYFSEIFTITAYTILFTGDPDDRSLRKVETEVVIPKLVREKARTEKCIPEVENFNKCCKESSVFMVFKCRDENASLKSCLASWYNNEEFKQLCTEEYLKERSEFRRTGIKKPFKRA